ncbi:MAG: DUF6485 family protein [Spirochaetaceae bacterium]|nr:DUF6485 family protein [Spirochaetaceae bacterium]
MAECTSAQNKKACNCSFNCARAGICCRCLNYHRRNGELPGCYFPADIEKTGDRSIKNFITIVQQRGTSYLAGNCS